jgi:hypothetical protein
MIVAPDINPMVVMITAFRIRWILLWGFVLQIK